jgi:ribosome-associated toxin RatA of RatAB toxin-antitoxin module
MIYVKIEKDQIKTKKNLDLFRILYNFWTMDNVSKFWEKIHFLMVFNGIYWQNILILMIQKLRYQMF